MSDLIHRLHYLPASTACPTTAPGGACPQAVACDAGTAGGVRAYAARRLIGLWRGRGQAFGCSCRKNVEKSEEIGSMLPMSEIKQEELLTIRKKPPAKIVIEPSEVPISDQPVSPLSPRELFFIDLIKAAKLPSVNTTLRFIEKEKEYCIFDDPVYKQEHLKIIQEPKKNFRSEAYIFLGNSA
ncbi:unnamed protein product [Acanthoscelides obtectus]|uniref:Uncharacterized protein n=1 Tax=Acanthoscelides obtectus TaxID=200917 RepID=A0A9P0PT11_ACAOB|nr:unnamed protein product [Acanthoscelides obtectus]CAK1655209.1 hypothetical protein AOBTE_LOCUS19080 [Acanthoscelides obtectus]